MTSLLSKSNKDYSVGDIIITCEPLVQVIHIQYKGKRCDNCHIIVD